MLSEVLLDNPADPLADGYPCVTWLQQPTIRSVTWLRRVDSLAMVYVAIAYDVVSSQLKSVTMEVTKSLFPFRDRRRMPRHDRARETDADRVRSVARRGQE